MRKIMRRICSPAVCLLLAVMIFATAVPMEASAKVGYTYNYDFWGDTQYSPDSYEVSTVVNAASLGLELNLMNPEGLCVLGDMIYVCDTGNNRILELKRISTEKIELVRVIESFTAPADYEKPLTFLKPSDISVTSDGYMYIADQNNYRVLKLDMDLNYVMEFLKPTDPTFNQEMEFAPKKIAIDTAGRLYCTAVSVNQGLMKYEPDGEFTGFFGATPVTYNLWDFIWKRWLSTQAQRDQMADFVPTEYSNIYMDYEGFIYATIIGAEDEEVLDGQLDVVRRLNLLGNDILIRNGEFDIIGDLYYGETEGYIGSSKFTDVTALENDVYVALDRNRGRLFAYDEQGRLMFAFGGGGTVEGCFRYASAIDHVGHDLLVLDSSASSLTVFTPTEFGALVYRAIEEFQNGLYTESGNTWREVMELNGNYDLAYIGIGRALFQEKKYKEAMEYFKLKYDEENYSRAFKQYRKEWVEDNIGLVIAAAFLVLCLPLIIGRIKAIKYEIDRAEIFIK